MPDEHGKISREEFLRLTGEEPQQPDTADMAEELRRLREAPFTLQEFRRIMDEEPQPPSRDELDLAELRDEMRRSWGS